jgi:hypothetical protein
MVLIGGVGVRPTSADLLSLVVTTLGYATSVGAAFVLVTWRRRPWVRVSTAGLELSATGRGVVLVPWSQVDAVALHGYGPSTRLVVTPTEDFATTTGTTAVVVDVATVRPSAATLLSEIDHAATRGAERPQAA